MGIRGSARIAAASFAALGAMALMPAATADTTPSFQDLCNVNQNTWVRYHPDGNRMYTIEQGGGFRVVGFSVNYSWAYGHGNGHSDGWIPNDGRLYNCHQT